MSTSWLNEAKDLVTILGSVATIASLIMYIRRGSSLNRYRYFSSTVRLHKNVYSSYFNLTKLINKYSSSVWDIFFWAVFLYIALIDFILLVYISVPVEELPASQEFFVAVVSVFFFGLVYMALKRVDISSSKLNENEVKKKIAGTKPMFLSLVFSFLVLVVFVMLYDLSDKYYVGSVIITALITIITVLLFSDVTTKAASVLWKIRVSEDSKLADSLPYLLVKTKTGNIFFGQLYDPLDDNLLILRNANLVVHGGQEVWDTLEKITFDTIYAKDGAKEAANYISIPWDDIETLQIVEDGLYKPPKTDAENKNESSESRIEKIKELTRCIRKCFSSEKNTSTSTKKETSEKEALKKEKEETKKNDQITDNQGA